MNNLPLFPKQILESYTLIEPQGIISVRGEVTSITLYADKYLYGTLKEDGQSITFRCAADQGPCKLRELVVIEGTLSVKPSNIHDGLQVQLNGSVVGRWERQENPNTPLIPERDRVKLQLVDFVRNHRESMKNLAVVGTGTGLSDYRAAIGADQEIYWEDHKIKLSTSKSFIKEIKSIIANNSPEAIAILRGGHDSGKGMDVWNDSEVIEYLLNTGCYIYSAIGHADGFVAIDKYADESFISPTSFGDQLIHALKKVEKENWLAKTYKESEAECSRLEAELDSFRSESESKITKIIKDETHKSFKLKKQRNFFIFMTGLTILALTTGAFFLV